MKYFQITVISCSWVQQRTLDFLQIQICGIRCWYQSIFYKYEEMNMHEHASEASLPQNRNRTLSFINKQTKQKRTGKTVQSKLTYNASVERKFNTTVLRWGRHVTKSSSSEESSQFPTTQNNKVITVLHTASSHQTKKKKQSHLKALKNISDWRIHSNVFHKVSFVYKWCWKQDFCSFLLR